jgi:integrase
MADFSRTERANAGGLPSAVQEAYDVRETLRSARAQPPIVVHDATIGEDITFPSIQAQTVEAFATDIAERIEADAGLAAAKQWLELATATATPTLLEAFADWMKETDITEATRAHYAMTLREFLRVVELHDALARQISDDHARRYVRWLNTEAKSRRGGAMSYKTKYGRVTALSSFWTDYLSRHAHVPQGRNPWKGHKITGRKKANVHGDEMKRPHTAEEMLRIINGRELAEKARYPKRTLLELYALGWLTGARLGEICGRLLGDVERTTEGYILHIRKSKTPGGVRSIPIVHPIAVAVLRRRIGDRDDPKAQLFEEFIPGGPERKLSWYPQKRLGRYRDLIGLDETTDTHSTRRDLISLLEAREVYPLWAMRYVGHVPEGVTFGVYSRVTPASLMEVAKAIRYPEPMEAALRAALGIA